jgi:Asp/Glu/hydantoin racemase
MRLLFLNPNTSVALTALGARLAREVARPDTHIVPATGRFGARYIQTRAAAAIAGHAALDAYARQRRDVDVVLLACFGDPGLLALREVAEVPVVGMAEAACRAAARHDGPFAIVTGGASWRPMLEEFVRAIGLGGRLAGVRTIAASGGEIAENPEAALAELAAAARDAALADGAAAVILGGLGLAGLAARIAARVPVPVIDSLAAGIAAAEAAVPSDWSARRRADRGRETASPPLKVSRGLSAALASLLEAHARSGA